MKPTLDVIVFIAALIAVALLADAWRSARRDSQQLAATLAAQNTVIQQAGDREKQRDSQLATALATIQTEKRAVRTPQQAAQKLSSVLPPLPLPVAVHGPDLSTPHPPGETPAASISIPQPDLLPLYEDLQDCRASAVENDFLKKDLSDEKTRSVALIHERDSAIAAARGGTFFVRLKRAAKWFAIGVATGAAVAAVAHH
jgi:type II secretory pathway pseudopilin PulG